MLSLVQVIKGLYKKMTHTEIADKEYVDKRIAEVIGGAPETLDTLKELSAALNNDKDFATTITNALANKLDKTAKAASASSADAVAWANVTGKPGSFTPAAHNQAWSTITGKPAKMLKVTGWNASTGALTIADA